MKVYELMKELSKMPAGAEVEVSALLTVNELTEDGPYDQDGREVFYELRKEVKEIEESISDTRPQVFLYL